MKINIIKTLKIYHLLFELGVLLGVIIGTIVKNSGA